MEQRQRKGGNQLDTFKTKRGMEMRLYCSLVGGWVAGGTRGSCDNVGIASIERMCHP